MNLKQTRFGDKWDTLSNVTTCKAMNVNEKLKFSSNHFNICPSNLASSYIILVLSNDKTFSRCSFLATTEEFYLDIVLDLSVIGLYVVIKPKMKPNAFTNSKQ